MFKFKLNSSKTLKFLQKFISALSIQTAALWTFWYNYVFITCKPVNQNLFKTSWKGQIIFTVTFKISHNYHESSTHILIKELNWKFHLTFFYSKNRHLWIHSFTHITGRFYWFLCLSFLRHIRSVCWLSICFYLNIFFRSLFFASLQFSRRSVYVNWWSLTFFTYPYKCWSTGWWLHLHENFSMKAIMKWKKKSRLMEWKEKKLKNNYWNIIFKLIVYVTSGSIRADECGGNLLFLFLRVIA